MKHVGTGGGMGKIFEALEKADRGNPASLRKSMKVMRAGNDTINKEKVVSLGNLNKYGNDNLLDPNLVTYYAPQSIESELFKLLRTNLLFPSEGPAPRTILVTSAVAGDGKSFVSANLGISIAQGVEEYVLLLDCDIRKPSIHSMFGYQQADGLSEYLARGTDLSSFILKTPVPKLSLLAGGNPPGNPAELLTSNKMKQLIKEVSGRYDDRYIIIDSPPLSVASETAAIAKLVDGVVLVVKGGKTPRHAATELIDQIGREKIVGIVFNFSDQLVKKYYDYGKSYYQTDKTDGK